MDNICFDKTDEIDNKNIPDEFIEIRKLLVKKNTELEKQ